MQVSGKVVDADNIPLYGASVYVKENPSNGMSANALGQFSLNVVTGQTVVVSFVGYAAQEFKATTTTPQTIVLLNNQELEEIIIPANQKSKTNLTWLWVAIGFTALAAGGAYYYKNQPQKVKV